MKFNEIIDPLYGRLLFPAFINRLLLCPELLRLKEIRMSNINFLNFPGFSDSTRYEHALGAAFLAHKLTIDSDLDEKDRLEIITAALFHDVATPPFGHITESVFKESFGFDHEDETARIILGEISQFRKTDIEPIYAGAIPHLKEIFNKTKNPRLDINNVYNYMKGRGKFGRLIKGDIDLDNIDNVVRSAYHIGLNVDKTLPIKLARSLVHVCKGNISVKYQNQHLIGTWLEVRNRLYSHLMLNKTDLNRECMLKYAIRKAVELRVMREQDWRLTDNELLAKLTNPGGGPDQRHYMGVARIVNRIRLGITFLEIGVYWISDRFFYENIRASSSLARQIDTDLTTTLGTDLVTNFWLDRRSRLIEKCYISVQEPLFQKSLAKKPLVKSFGEERTNVLLGVYSVLPTIVKKDGAGKPVLDETGRQMKYRRVHLREVVLQLLSQYLADPSKIRNLTPAVIEANDNE